MAGVLELLPLALVAYGAVAVLWTTRYAMAGRQFRDPRRALLAVRGIRLALFDVLLIAAGLGWWFGLHLQSGCVVLAAALELFESSVAIHALREQVQHG